MMTTGRVRKYKIVGSAVTALLIQAANVHAADRFWNNPLGGFFLHGSNWDDGRSAAPGLSDTAIFDLDASFEVDFIIVDTVTDRMVVRRGAVSLYMVDVSTQDGSYTLLNPIPIMPGIVVGDAPDASASLIPSYESQLFAKSMSIAQSDGSSGAVRLEQFAICEIDDFLSIGYQGNGSLEIIDQAQLTSGETSVAHAFESTGVATVIGPHSIWEIDGTCSVGKNGVGVLMITDGADVASDGAIIGQQDFAMGSATVSGPGSSWYIFGTLDVGMNAPGELLIDNGGAVFCFDFASLGTFGTEPTIPEPIGMGELTVRGATSLFHVQGDLFVGYLGEGALRIGQNARVQLDGDLLNGIEGASGAITLELASSTDFITPAIIAGGLAQSLPIEIELIDGFTPALGDRFVAISAAQGIAEMDITLPALPLGLAWSIDQSATLLAFEIVESGVTPDLNGDGQIGFADLLLLLDAWGPCPPGECPADLDDSGDVDFTDLLALLNEWS